MNTRFLFEVRFNIRVDDVDDVATADGWPFLSVPSPVVKVVTTFKANAMRTATLIVLVAVMAYVTAFMETLTISGFPYYTFEDRNMAYIIGSAFYGIYFIVRQAFEFVHVSRSVWMFEAPG